MISIVIFILGCIVTLVASVLAFTISLKQWVIYAIVITSILGMIALNAIVAVICCKILPNKWFEKENKFYVPSKKECKFYERIGIKKWKDDIIELGKLNGFSKNKIESANSEYIHRFIIENKRGFLTHFISLFISVLAIFILPMKFWLPTALPITITSFILNFMPAMILRYNMPRLKTLLKFSERNKITTNK